MSASLEATDPDELLNGLNEQQKAAVVAQSTPLCIRAGAGTGKTRVLTRRIAYQSLTGRIDPRHTLAITFTRKAADELRSRLAGLGLGGSASAGTFHSTAYAQLRTRWAEQGVRAPELMSNKLGLMARIAQKTKPRLARADLLKLATEIEWAKARRIQPECYAESAVRARRWSGTEPALIADFYQQYENEKRRRHMVDFDDLLILAMRDLTENPEYAEARRWQFQHLFVDEFQDMNPLQFDLLRAWLGDKNDLCAVGDANQAIYGWNGAEADYIERFDHWFPGAQVLDLVDNYRSSPQILDAAKRVLGSLDSSLIATCADGPSPQIYSHVDQMDEADAIAQMLRDAKGPEVAWSSMAVLVRTNAQIGTLTSAMERATIPFRVRTTARHLESNSPLNGEPKIDQSIDGVDVATFHAAKGLEWPIVHLVGLEEGLVPICYAQEPAERAEEQRLLHVAITRAERELHCHWAAERVFGDRTVPRTPSRYLGAIREAG